MNTVTETRSKETNIMPNSHNPNRRNKEEEPEDALPKVFSSIEPIDEVKSIEILAEELRIGTAFIPRKDVEFYNSIRHNDTKARNFLLLLLEAHHSGSLYLNQTRNDSNEEISETDEEIESSLSMSNLELEEMFMLDQLLKAAGPSSLTGSIDAHMPPTPVSRS